MFIRNWKLQGTIFCGRYVANTISKFNIRPIYTSLNQIWTISGKNFLRYRTNEIFWRYGFELENLVCAISQEIFARFCSYWFRGVYGYLADPSRFWWPWRNIQGHYEEICLWVRKSRLRDISRNICPILFIFNSEVYIYGYLADSSKFWWPWRNIQGHYEEICFVLEYLVCAISQEVLPDIVHIWFRDVYIGLMLNFEMVLATYLPQNMVPWSFQLLISVIHHEPLHIRF